VARATPDGYTLCFGDKLPNSLPHIRAGAIKAYAVMAKERLSAAPDVPTVDEAGLPGPYMSPGRRFACQKGVAKWGPIFKAAHIKSG
jgi:tripartite-type tricarboxylate transporter receptor subunit TctC